MNRAVAALTIGAVAAAPCPFAVQLAFAIVGIGIVGMVHGAGDLAAVDHHRRPHFLAAYAIASLVTLLWWSTAPAAALPAFLAASALHFGIEDAPSGPLWERVGRGVALIAAPAAFHTAEYAALLRIAGGAASGMAILTPLLALAGAVAALVLLMLAWQRRDGRLAGGMAALLLLPPLVGFTLGFLILHALPQTIERRDRLGFGSTRAYLAAVAPVLAGAIVLAGLVAAALLHFDPSGVRGLFAGIAALAVPHLLVTPWFEAHAVQHRTALAGEAG